MAPPDKTTIDELDSMLTLAEKISASIYKIRNKRQMLILTQIFCASFMVFFVVGTVNEATDGFNNKNTLFFYSISAGSFVVLLLASMFFFRELSDKYSKEIQAFHRISRILFDVYDYMLTSGELPPLQQAEIEVRLSRLELSPRFQERWYSKSA